MSAARVAKSTGKNIGRRVAKGILRGILAVFTGGASETIFQTIDFADGICTGAELLAELSDMKDVGEDFRGALMDEYKKNSNKKYDAKTATETARRVIHCGKCGAKGVNARSHVKGHALANKHKW